MRGVRWLVSLVAFCLKATAMEGDFAPAEDTGEVWNPPRGPFTSADAPRRYRDFNVGEDPQDPSYVASSYRRGSDRSDVYRYFPRSVQGYGPLSKICDDHKFGDLDYVKCRLGPLRDPEEGEAICQARTPDKTETYVRFRCMKKDFKCDSVRKDCVYAPDPVEA